ncbi:cupin domain-containing protein [Stigmatella sp. ncwal1]|uniref:Cupin domain-containing protein n=1 Tax=Stigmatella ashevillensis TaxID=2995309 RepID=A0ABT5D8S0_9BACT|nr:cupin domain-containing protein [Stigmatella ashevillena]MDC0709460.1 cupin domain-containing protein [Stigmatella ashevillena]
MKLRTWIIGVALTLFTAAGAGAHGAAENVVVKPAFDAPIPNIPGKSLRTVTVSYVPGGKSGAHRHANSAFIYAYVLEGAIRSQVDGEPPRVYRAGEAWTENPGAHHVVSENASKTQPAKLLAVFVVDTDDTTLTTPDPH